MQTKVKDFLFELIKSLTKSEKRYFKLHASRHTIGEENAYVTLFDYLDRMQEYDEAKVFNHFKGAAFLNRFSITKKRLYDHVLSSLDDFHTTHSIDAKLNKSIHSADILFNKGLYEQSSRVIKSAIKLATSHQRFTILFSLRRRQKQLIENLGYVDFSLAELTAVKDEDQVLLAHEAYYSELWNMKSVLFHELGRKGKARSPQEIGTFEQIIEQLKPIPVQLSHSFEITYLYHHILSAYYFAVDDMISSYDHLKKNSELFVSNPEQIQLQLNKYFSLITNTIYVAEKLGYQRDADTMLKQLKSTLPLVEEQQHEDLRIKYFASVTSSELSLVTQRGSFRLTSTQLSEIKRQLDQYSDKISATRRSYIRFKVATILLANGDLSAALKWVNKILNDEGLEASEDIRSYTHLLHMLIHLDLKNNDVLTYMMKNTQRFLKSRNRLHGFEQSFLNFLTKRLKCTTKLEELDCWEELYLQLSKLKEDSFEHYAFDYFDLMHWAESKFKETSFIELVQRSKRVDQV